MDWTTCIFQKNLEKRKKERRKKEHCLGYKNNIHKDMIMRKMYDLVV